MSKKAHDEIAALVNNFVGQLTELVRESTVRTVEEALTGTSSSGGAGMNTRARVGKKRTRTTPKELEAMGGKVLTYLGSNPGVGATHLAEELGVTTKDLRRPLQLLLESRMVRTRGQRRGTKYYPVK